MDRGSYLLKMEKDFYDKISLVEKVIDKPLFESLYYNEPFLCRLVLEKFKTYFEDAEFDKIERQVILLKFLQNNYPIELSREVVKFCQQCKFSEDYERVIMEWNYSCSDFIKQSVLSEYDATALAFDFYTKDNYDKKRTDLNKVIDITEDIARLLFKKEDEGENNGE